MSKICFKQAKGELEQKIPTKVFKVRIFFDYTVHSTVLTWTV